MNFLKTLAAVTLLAACSAHAQEKTYDVVIAGAGTGGVAAALQAARLGARVALVEETDWIGGQMTAASVSTMDEGGTITQNSGIYGEFLHRMTKYYDKRGKSIHTCYYTILSHCFEPSAAQRVLYSMIEETRAQHHVLDVYLQHRIVRVLTDGDTVTGAVLEPALTLHSAVLIDATELGDVLPLTPAAYRIGNSTSDNIDQSACVQGITYVAVMKKYKKGVPKELQMHTPPPGYSESLRKRLQMVLRKDGNAATKVPPVDLAMHNVYRGLPDSSIPGDVDITKPTEITRSELNWFNDFPFYVRDFTGANKTTQVCQAKLKTLQMVYYIQHDMGEHDWSVANDEGFDGSYNEQHSCSNIPQEFREIENNLPPIPYFRESRRLIGVYTLTASDIRREGNPQQAVVNFPSSIAVGDYADDLHGCNREANLEPSLEHAADSPPGFRGGPFQVPLGSLIPIRVDGLLAAEKNISQSRLANGATRLQPITMLTGQAAGALAAIAVREHLQPRQVRPEVVQRTLLDAGAVLAKEQNTDVEPGTELWKAVEFVQTKGWMSSHKGAFEPQSVVTRGEAAELLAAAYEIAKPFNEFRPAVVTHPTFSDVPLWDRFSVPVERLYALKAVTACQTQGMFCPSESASRDSFLRSADLLNHRKGYEEVPTAMPLGEQSKLTRGDAALILYRMMTALQANASMKTTAANHSEVKP
ncbi:MAG: FAD-dependent oxidoreductase [Acidobacteriaceae bacterium]|nr:FAD-dependent oxidoreductase [Acidobacteriaceae bacterium]